MATTIRIFFSPSTFLNDLSTFRKNQHASPSCHVSLFVLHVPDVRPDPLQVSVPRFIVRVETINSLKNKPAGSDGNTVGGKKSATKEVCFLTNL